MNLRTKINLLQLIETTQWILMTLFKKHLFGETDLSPRASIDNSNIYNGVYHDNDILKLSEDRFCSLPRYLGFMGAYQEDSLMFAKATIDGVKKPEAISNKEVMPGVYISKIKEPFYPITN